MLELVLLRGQVPPFSLNPQPTRHYLPDLLGDDLYAAAPSLSNVLYLHTQPMTALDIYFTRKISELPHEHVMLTEAKFGLSFIDVSGTWPDHDTTVLQVIASDFISLETLSQDKAEELIIEELKRYLPFEDSDIETCVFQPHLQEPLFINDVGAWQFRPNAPIGGLANMYLAGDYCRSPVDLTCMEAAITSGLRAAQAIGHAAGKAPLKIEYPPHHPDWQLVLAKRVLMPVAALTKLATLIGDGE